jgi:hypothetical protein
MKFSEIKKRWLLVKNVIKIALMKPKDELTDSIVIGQWTRYNNSQAVVRSVNTLLGLLVGQIAIVKNEKPRLNINNREFVDWVSSGLKNSLKKNAKNTPPYDRFHVRKVKMRVRKMR